MSPINTPGSIVGSLPCFKVDQNFLPPSNSMLQPIQPWNADVPVDPQQVLRCVLEYSGNLKVSHEGPSIFNSVCSQFMDCTCKCIREPVNSSIAMISFKCFTLAKIHVDIIIGSWLWVAILIVIWWTYWAAASCATIAL